MFRFRPGYLLASLVLLAVLVAIALWVRDAFVRPFLGDVLAVVFVYTATRAVLALRVHQALITAAVIAFGLECAQYLHLIDVLGLGHIALARIVLGATFDPLDLLAYLLGAALTLGVETWRSRHTPRRSREDGHPDDRAHIR